MPSAFVILPHAPGDEPAGGLVEEAKAELQAVSEELAGTASAVKQLVRGKEVKSSLLRVGGGMMKLCAEITVDCASRRG